jgi:hypothetical protein
VYCKLCRSDACRPFAVAENAKRHFYHCERCGLVFVPSPEYISIPAEKQRYDLHTNSRSDAGYVEYLTRFSSAIKKIPLSNPCVLDFGSGPNQVFADILRNQGNRCDAYDPLYAVGLEALNKVYDIVAACEVIEHLRDLRDQILLIDKVTDKKGYIVFRTQYYPCEVEFNRWWYAQDITHINFFSLETMRFIADFLRRAVIDADSADITVLGPR